MAWIAKEDSNPWEPNPIHIITGFALLQLVITLFSDGFVLSFDEAMWHYIGRNWFRHGMAPYAGGVDNKSPLIFAIFGLSDQLFGVNYWFPRLLGTFVQSVGIYYVYKIARQMAGVQTGMLAILFYGLSLLWHATGGKYVSYTETYGVTFIIIAFYHFLTAQNNKAFFISGLLAGIALGFRLTAIFGIVAIFITSLRKSRRDTLMFCVGVLTSILFLLMAAFFAGIDLHNLYTYTLADNFGSGSPTDHNLSWKIENFSNKFFFSGMILFYPLMMAYFIIKSRMDWLGLWLILAFTGISIIGIYDTVHLKELLPALSLMSAFAVAHLTNIYKVPVKWIYLLLIILFFPRLSEPLSNLKRLIRPKANQSENYCRQPYTIPDEGTRKRLGLWVRENTAEHDKVFVAGFGAQVQVYTERLSPTIYFNVTQTHIAKERFFQDMQANKPKMILVPLFPEYREYVGGDLLLYVDELVAKDYYLDRCMYNYNIYRKKK